MHVGSQSPSVTTGQALTRDIRRYVPVLALGQVLPIAIQIRSFGRATSSRPALLPGWAQIEEVIPAITVPMRRYLEQVACVLRPGSVSGADLALRSFAAFLADASSPATSLAGIARRHVEDFKPWLAARPGQNKPRLTPATIAHRLGTLRMFFVSIEEWGCPADGANVTNSDVC